MTTIPTHGLADAELCDTHLIGDPRPGATPWRAELRAVVSAENQPMVAGPFGSTWFWPEGTRFDVHEGDAIFGIWHDRPVAGGYPMTSLLCRDPECALTLWHVSEDGRRWSDPHVLGTHFAVLRDTPVPGTAPQRARDSRL
ncbi:MAG: hypothetical protein ACK5IM_15025 [Demequina sp.]|uniref:hypothetical protein n=1 Tax=Demequina sp. TaxID=2050685 RepID=UPI003A8521D1